MEDRQSVPIVVPGGYRLGQRLRGGPEADLYEAFHPRIPGRYIVKILSRALAQDAKEVKAFRADAEVTASLRHPNIVQVYDIHQLPDGRPFVVMELLEGADLEERLAGQTALPVIETLSIVKQTAGALQAAHGRGVVHRDLRPGNIFLAQVEGHDGGFVKLLNFGMSNLRTTSMAGPSNIHFVGSPHTMAPEQALGHINAIDGRTDQFALAAIAFRMLSGIHAFRGDDALAVLYQIVHERPRSLGLRSALPAGVESVIQRGLAKDKGERFETVLEFARALEASALMSPVPAAPQHAGAPRLDPSAHLRPTPLMGVRPDPRGADEFPQTPFGMDDGGGPVFDDPAASFDDGDDLDALLRPKRRGRKALAFLFLVAGAAAGVVFAGDRLPVPLRQHPLWHTLRLPHALPDQTAAAVAPASGSGASATTQNPLLPEAPAPASAAAQALATPDAGADARTARDAAPDARIEVMPSAAIAQAGSEKAAAREHTHRPRGHARKGDAPPPGRNYIWSDKEQRLVPVGSGALPIPLP